MNLYIDQENLLSLISQREDKLYPDCVKTMQKQLNVAFNFDKKAISESEVLTAWFKMFTSGIGESNKQWYDKVKFPVRPIDKNTLIKLERGHLSSCYLILDDEISFLKDSGAVLMGGLGEEIWLFSNLFLMNKDYKFEKKIKIGGPEFTSWKHLESYSCSTTDIIFVDPYILVNEADVFNNFIPYIQTLACKSKCQINLVLYTDKSKINISFAELKKNVISALRAVTGITPKFTLIKYIDQRGVASYAEHDRTIFTNYFRVYSGDTFNYFDSKGGVISKGREIQYSGFGDLDNQKLAHDLIADLQNNIRRLPKEAIEGDMQSNFLLFT